MADLNMTDFSKTRQICSDI